MMPIPPLVNMVPIEPIMPKKTFNVVFRESGRNINDNNRKITYIEKEILIIEILNLFLMLNH